MWSQRGIVSWSVHVGRPSDAYPRAMSHADLILLGHVAVGFGICYVIGFERHMRGSPAGDRTFALVGTAATAVTAVAAKSSPQAIAGVVTGIGFIGAGLVFQREGDMVHGLTTAATIFTSAAIGVVVGYGHLFLALVTAAMLLLTLELRHIKGLRILESSYLLERRRQRAEARGDPEAILGGGGGGHPRG